MQKVIADGLWVRVEPKSGWRKNLTIRRVRELDEAHQAILKYTQIPENQELGPLKRFEARHFTEDYVYSVFEELAPMPPLPPNFVLRLEGVDDTTLSGPTAPAALEPGPLPAVAWRNRHFLHRSHRRA